MDSERFNIWTRALHSRRAALGGLVGGGLGLLGLGACQDVDAKKLWRLVRKLQRQSDVPGRDPRLPRRHDRL